MREKRLRAKKLWYKRFKTKVLIAFIAMLFFPTYTKIENMGDNLFQITLNGQYVGVVGSREDADECLQSARRNIAKTSTEIILMESDMELAGSAVMWAELDDKNTVIARMEEALKQNAKETLHRAYTVKINEYTINLDNKDAVLALLQTSIDKYDEEDNYTVELVLDPNRELNVLTTEIITSEEVKKREDVQSDIFIQAGIYATLNDIFESVQPRMELDFEDYELGLLTMEYGDRVEVVESYLPENQISSLEAAIDEVTKDQEKNEIYEVVPGDTLSGISLTTNIPMDKLIAMNENLTDENSTIRIGDELIITVPEPELSVNRDEEVYYEEDYEADVIYIDNDDWYTNEQVTRQEPSTGHRKVVAIVSYHNDTVVNTDIIKEEVTYEPVAKIVERGTKIPPTYIKPISGGRLSSGFGRRNAPKKGASSYHKGIDWATPTGTAVMASCGGVVAKAGWGSGYGYVVYINHADGRQTRYGHLSKVLVSVGQTVSQGQKIALSGNTGVSTGPHIHFEILINGSQVNPLKYMN